MPVRPSEPGMVKCLKCQKPFKSPDRIRIRRCTPCKRDEESHVTRLYRIHLDRGVPRPGGD